MGRKRKDGCSISSAAAVSIWSVDDDYRNEMMKLTKVAKAWDFTCSFCFKKFPSAQALGGHQNAHRNERLEEKRLLVRDPVAYRKRAFLRSMKADQGSSSSTVDNHHHHMNHAEEEVKAACSIRFSSFGDSFDHNLDLTLKL